MASGGIASNVRAFGAFVLVDAAVKPRLDGGGALPASAFGLVVPWASLRAGALTEQSPKRRPEG